jgi:hypothetical protein
MKPRVPPDGCPMQLEFDLGPDVVVQRSGDGWRYKPPSRWTKREAQVYHRRAKAAREGNGEAQRECLSWLDAMLTSPPHHSCR